MAEFMGKTIEELAEEYGLDLRDDDISETPDDRMRQAQAVLYFVYNKGAGFKYKKCKQCKGEFAYNYSSDGVGYCSITCAAKSLEEIGLSWDPRKPPEQRWAKCIPAVVPPQVLSILSEEPDFPQEIPTSDIDYEWLE